MSNYAALALSKQELRQMQEDWRRTDHNLTQVAELHACTRADVVAALGLTEADLKPRQRKKYPSWETQNPEKAAEFVRLLAGGAKMTEACKAVGIEKTDTGYKIYNRIRERNALMSNEEKIVTAVAQAIQPSAADQPEPVRPEDYTVDRPVAPAKTKKSARALADALDGMDTLVDVLNRKKLLSDDEVEVCERVMALADAFRVGIEYGEALKNV